MSKYIFHAEGEGIKPFMELFAASLLFRSPKGAMEAGPDFCQANRSAWAFALDGVTVIGLCVLSMGEI